MELSVKTKPKISVIVPVKNEEQALPIFYKTLIDVLLDTRQTYEIIFIDDGSVDNSLELLSDLQKTNANANIRLIRFRANLGKSQALSEGFKQARGDIIITIDADLQDDPREIPKLIKKIQEGYDLVSGWRKKRIDPLSKKISSWFFNRGTSFISGVKLHDFNCGLKAFTKEVTNELNLHGELHRFIPVIAAKKQFKVTEIIVNHHARKYGKSKYGFGRSWKGFIDLITTIFISDFGAKPAHFFGAIGLVFFAVGFIMDAFVTYVKITTGTIENKYPLLLAGILFMVVGVQLLSTGLLAEMIIRMKDKN